MAHTSLPVCGFLATQEKPKMCDKQTPRGVPCMEVVRCMQFEEFAPKFRECLGRTGAGKTRANQVFETLCYHAFASDDLCKACQGVARFREEQEQS